MDGSTALVFDPNPDTVWNRLIARTESRVALARRPFDLESELAAAIW
jgi:hypothetical protein